MLRVFGESQAAAVVCKLFLIGMDRSKSHYSSSPRVKYGALISWRDCCQHLTRSHRSRSPKTTRSWLRLHSDSVGPGQAPRVNANVDLCLPPAGISDKDCRLRNGFHRLHSAFVLICAAVLCVAILYSRSLWTSCLLLPTNFCKSTAALPTIVQSPYFNYIIKTLSCFIKLYI